MAIVVQLSDLHLSADGGHAERCAAAAVEAVVDDLDTSRGAADLVLLTGDITDDGTVAAAERVATLVERFDAPVAAVPGNHDLPASITRVFGAIDPAPVGSWRIVSVDSTIPGAVHGRADPEAVAAQLEEDPDRPTMLVLHHPLSSPSTHPDFQLEGAAGLIEVVVARPWVRVIASGHLHELLALDIGAARQVIAPSTWYGLHHDGPTYALADDSDGDGDGDETVGALVWELNDDGTASHRMIPRLRVSTPDDPKHRPLDAGEA